MVCFRGLFGSADSLSVHLSMISRPILACLDPDPFAALVDMVAS